MAYGEPGPRGYQPPGPLLLGTTRKKKSAGPPSGEAGPSQVPESSDRDPRPPTEAGHKCPYCDRPPFSSKSGLGVHIRSAHPDAANDKINTDRAKARWSAEEALRLAHQEAQITVNSGVRSMVQALHPFFPHRTLESIKGQLRKSPHRLQVEDFIKSIQNPAPPTCAATSPSPSPQDPPDISMADLSIWNYINKLPTPSGRFAVLKPTLDYQSIPNADILQVHLHDALDFIFPVSTPVHQSPSRPSCTGYNQPLSNTKTRRQHYAKCQSSFKKNPARCINSILDGSMFVESPIIPGTVNFWRRL